MDDRDERAKRKLAEHESDLIKAMGEDYQSDPRYVQMVQDVARGRAASNAIADLRDGF